MVRTFTIDRHGPRHRERDRIFCNAFYSSGIMNFQFPDIRPGKGLIGTLDTTLIEQFKNNLLHQSPVKLNIGAGDDIRPISEGWINIDGITKTGIDVVANVENLWMFPNECIDVIEANHILEHIEFRYTIRTLQEWTRILKVGGQLIIRVPDVGKMCQRYMEGSWQIGPDKTERNIINVLYGNIEPEHLEYREVFGFHKAGFDQRLIKTYLEQLNYVNVQVTDSDRGHEFELYSYGEKSAMEGF